MRNNHKEYFIWIISSIFVISMFCTGIFFEYLSCAFSVLLSVLLIIKISKTGELVLYKNLTVLSIVSLIIFYAISILWAIDSGMAVLGFMKFLPVLFFLIIIMQDKEQAEHMINILPYAAVGMVVISSIGRYIPIFKTYFSVAGRLAGFFQYPNTFAILLLISELLVISKKRKKILDYFLIAILIMGLLLTGSRTVFVLAIFANLVFVMVHLNKRARIYGIVSILTIIILVMVLAILLGENNIVMRLFRLSLSESTFIGRILYFVDAIPVILKHPFGLGYMGYYYIQQSIQSGLYSVRFIHNDFLQILLDVGWIPCMCFLVAIVKSLCSKQVCVIRKLILVVICLHSCFDFNLQFVTMFCLLLLFMDYDTGEKVEFRKSLGVIKGTAVVITGLCIYMGAALGFEQAGNYSTALKMYPWNTQAATAYLTEIDDIEHAGEVANTILQRNEYVTVAQSVKARQAYMKGDFGSVIIYKNALLEKAPYQYEEYEEYARMLINGITLYGKAGDEESAAICEQELLAIPTKLENAKENISRLGKMIKDQPVTELSKELKLYIEKLEDTR